MVVNLMVVAMAVHSHNRPCDDVLMIYQIGSSLRNPINGEEFTLHMYYYLKNNPFGHDKKKKPIKVLKTLSPSQFHRYVRICYVPLLKVIIDFFIIKSITFMGLNFEYLII